MPKEKKTTDLRALQAHQKVVGISSTFQDMDGHARSSYEEYAAKGDDVVGEIASEIHSKMVKRYWF